MSVPKSRTWPQLQHLQEECRRHLLLSDTLAWRHGDAQAPYPALADQIEAGLEMAQAWLACCSTEEFLSSTGPYLIEYQESPSSDKRVSSWIWRQLLRGCSTEGNGETKCDGTCPTKRQNSWNHDNENWGTLSNQMTSGAQDIQKTSWSAPTSRRELAIGKTNTQVQEE